MEQFKDLTDELIDFVVDSIRSDDSPEYALERAMDWLPQINWEELVYRKCECGKPEMIIGWGYCNEHKPPPAGTSSIDLQVMDNILRDVFEKSVSEGVNNYNPLKDYLK